MLVLWIEGGTLVALEGDLSAGNEGLEGGVTKASSPSGDFRVDLVPGGELQMNKQSLFQILGQDCYNFITANGCCRNGSSEHSLTSWLGVW